MRVNIEDWKWQDWRLDNMKPYFQKYMVFTRYSERKAVAIFLKTTSQQTLLSSL